MSEVKYTPGPWTIGRSADNTPLVMVPTPTSEGSGFGVACVNRIPRMGSVGGDMDANARLIAASPDLLAVAQMVLETASDTTPPDLLAAATAAIAKAEGR